MCQRAMIILLIFACAGAERLSAQTCYRGRPAPACKVFFVTEAGYTYKLTAGAEDDAVHYVSGEIGAVTNRGRFAFGGTAFFGGLGGTGELGAALRGGVKGRVRRWLSPDAALDLSLGPMLSGDGDLGISSHLGISLADKLLLLAQFESVGGESDWYFGVRLGSQPAIIASLVAGVLLGIGALLVSG